MDLYCLEDGDIFRWENQLYRFLGEISDDGTAKVVCIGRIAGDRFRYVEKSHEENFNAYIEINTLI